MATWDWSEMQMAEWDWLRGWVQPGKGGVGGDAPWGYRTRAGWVPWMVLGRGDVLWERGGWGGMQPLE